MRLGIVGHEAAKFTEETEASACSIIRFLFDKHDPTEVISGGCHLGGIDRWAIDLAKQEHIPTREFLPDIQKWQGLFIAGVLHKGYKERNELIAQESDKVICIVVKKLPEEYKGMRFGMCYHCKTDSHVKSGGCWTARYGGKLGKPFEIIEI